ncbi:hypothetical protein E4T50_01071 [Aureobasidium sp. EXF-12298]|nr:hypothetical protein E4T50_01071 [Aureobasidium sp. EXF-12298]
MATLGQNNGNIPQSDQVDPAQAQGAQIPLQTFSLPQFPAQAGGLRALTLTSDIKLDDYQTLLSEPFAIPQLPPGIESLTLELFTLGYPVGWLSQLADRLPNLKSLVIYSQLFGGVTSESQADGIEFFRKLPGLRALHLLDVFAQPKFFEGIGPYITYSSDDETARRGLMFLEINYTVQHSDPEFLGKIQATELNALIGPGLVTLAFNVSQADVTDDPEDPTNNGDKNAAEAAKDGVVALNRTLGSTLVKALTDEATRPRGLRVLNSTLFTLTTNQLRTILETQKNLMVLNATLEVDDHQTFKKDLLSTLAPLEYLEQVDIVANPSLQFFLAIQNIKHKAFENTFPSQSEIEALAEKCKRLASFKADILRSSAMQTVEWEKKDEKWSGGVQAAKTELKISEVE